MFIVQPRIGLCNQLQSIVKTLLLGIKYVRNVYIDGFQIDLDSNRIDNINEVLDIDRMNNFFKECNLSVRINKKIDSKVISNIEKYKMADIDYNTIPLELFINDKIENNLHKNVIFVGNPVSLSLESSFDIDSNNFSSLYYLLITNIFFKKKFYDIKDYLKEQLNLTNFTCVHLRIEDDALSHFSNCYNLTIDKYNEILLDFYLDKINKTDNKIYICSGILDYSNKINLKFYNELTKKNKNICDKRYILIPNYIKKNRELIAIIDLLMALDSNSFIGCWISSFSQIINAYFINKSKSTELFKCLQ
jgi:hypothetical protein